MSNFGKDADPSKRFNDGVGGQQKDCDACGNRDHVHQASKDNDWDQKKQNELASTAQASADRAQEKSGGILGP